MRAELTALQGFKEQIYDVYRYLPPYTQIVLVSATLTRGAFRCFAHTLCLLR